MTERELSLVSAFLVGMGWGFFTIGLMGAGIDWKFAISISIGVWMMMLSIKMMGE